MNEMVLLAQAAQDVGFAFGGLFLVYMVLGILGLVLWIWALISAIQNPALDNTMRIVWILVIVFTGFVGAIIYLLVARKGATVP